MRGDATILPSLPDNFSWGITRPASDSGARVGDAVLPAPQSESDEPDAWLPDEIGMGARWLSGILTGLGLLGILLCDTLGLDEAPDGAPEEVFGEALGAGAGGGLLGAALGGGLAGGLLGELFVEECCAKTADENSRIAATTRLGRRIKHLLSNHLRNSPSSRH